MEKQEQNSKKARLIFLIATICILCLSLVGCFFLIKKITKCVGIALLVVDLCMTAYYLWMAYNYTKKANVTTEGRFLSFITFVISIIMSGAVYDIIVTAKQDLFLDLMAFFAIMPILWFFCGIFIYQDKDIRPKAND